MTLLTGPSTESTLPLLNALQHDQFLAGSFIGSFVILYHILEDGTDSESVNSKVFDVYQC